MATSDDIAILKKLSLFQVMNEEQIRLLTFGSEHLYIPKNHTLFSEGENADCAYVIVNGSLNLYRQKQRGKSLHETVKKGALLSEIALLTKTTRTFSAVACERSYIIQLNRQLFFRLLKEYPEITEKIYKYIQNRMRELAQEVTRKQPFLPYF